MAASRTSPGVALVTGAAVRLGAAIADRLAASGRDVVLHCNRSVAAAAELARSIEDRHGVRAWLAPSDLSRREAGRLVEQATHLAGRPLDVLVNSASVYLGDALEDMTPESFDLHMAVNVRAPLFLTQAFAAQGIESGSVVNVLDQRVLRPTPTFFGYSLSKGAFHAATTMAAQALAPRGIRVNAVAPGLTLPGESQDRAEFARRVASLPLARGGSAAEVAEAVAFLVGAAPSVTGLVIPIDGGQHLAWQDADVPDALLDRAA